MAGSCFIYSGTGALDHLGAGASPYGIKPNIQEKSCEVEFGTTGVQLSLGFGLSQANPTADHPLGGPPKLFSSPGGFGGCLPSK